MADRKHPTRHAATAPYAGILIDFDTVAIAGRRLQYDLLHNLLQEREATLTPVLFARYCVAPSPRYFVPRLLQALGKTRHSAERLITELQQNLQLAMADGSVALDADVVAVLDAARARQCRAGAVSALSTDACAALSERLGLPERGLTLVSYEQDVQFGPGPDVWRGLCRTLQVSPLRSFAVVSDQHACRAALLGGLRCVVRPDAYTGFQDFGGADLVVDRLSPAVFDALPAPQHA